MDTSYQGSHILDLFSKYAVNRNNNIAKLISRCIPFDNDKEINILEFGAGKGEFINRLSTDKRIKTFAVEADESFRKILASKHKVFSSIEEINDEMDFIFLIDVLEHLEDDDAYLKKFYQKLKKGGRLLIYVPARQELYSDFDRSIGHFRRYDKSGLKKKIESAQFKIEKCHYHELLGYFASAFHNLVLKKSQPSVSSLKSYDSILVPFTNLIESVIPPPVGKSLYLYAYK